MQRLLKRLNDIKYKKPKPSAKLLKNAHYIVASCWSKNIKIVDVYSVSNGIWFSFWKNDIYIDLELKKSGSISVMLKINNLIEKYYYQDLKKAINLVDKIILSIK